MKKTLISISFICTALLTSCFGTMGGFGQNGLGQTNTQNGIYTNGTQTPTTGNSSLLGGLGQNSLLGSIIGSFLNTTNQNTIIGTWTYSQPSIQFESTNFLAQAGGAVASQQMVQKISPYYEKLGIKPGACTLTLNTNQTCVIALSNRTINGTYTYDQQQGTITVTSQTGMKLFTAFVSVNINQLALTLDTTNLLNLIQNVSAKSTNSTLNNLSDVASAFSGMKTGFLFVK